jgi:predicted anti-sigma-YlaC factor YlaD
LRNAMSDNNPSPDAPVRGLRIVPDLPTNRGGDIAGESLLRIGKSKEVSKEVSKEALCLAMREVWSASLDGEALDAPLDALSQTSLTETMASTTLTLDDVTSHMLRCSNCAAVAQSAESFRRLRVRSVGIDTLPDLRPALRATITRDAANPWRKEKVTTTSVAVPGRRFAMAPSILIALAITGLAQAIGALPDLLGSANGGALSGAITGVEHLTREAAASEIALAAGFLSVAVKPFTAAAVRLFATVLTALVIFSTLTSGGTGTGGLPLEAHHLIALFGTTLLWLLPANTPAFASFVASPTRARFSGPSFHQ